MKSKIDKAEMRVLADELDKEVLALERNVEIETKKLETKRMYAKAARAIFLGLEYGGIK